MDGEIVVTAANGVIGRAFLARLASAGVAATALVRRSGELDAPTLENWMMSRSAANAIRRARTIYHLAGAVNPLRGNSFRAANVLPARRIAKLAAKGRAERIVFISAPDASADDPNAFLRTKGEAETVLLQSGVPTTILRAGPIIGDPDDYPPGGIEDAMISKDGATVSVFGDGTQPLRAVWRGDVLTALERAADRPAGIYDLVGPAPMTVADVVRILNRGRDVKIKPVPDFLARLIGLLAPGLTPAFVDINIRGLDGDPRALESAFEMRTTPLEEIWTRA